jgi:hypothetical protein
MKKIFYIVVAFFVINIPQAFAQGFVALSPINGLTDPETVNSSSNLAMFFNNLYKYLIGVAAVLAVIEIIWGGLEIATQDSITKNKDGKDRIRGAILGLVLVLSPVLVFSIINPNILNLSLNLKELKGPTTSPTEPTKPVLPPCVEGRTTNCTPVEPKLEGYYPSAQPGLWCYGVKPYSPNPTGGVVYNFVCSSKQSDCEYLFKWDENKTESCRKY